MEKVGIHEISEKKAYHELVDQNNTLKLREYIATLPRFMAIFFRGIHDITSSRTQIAYAYDLHMFFQYLHDHNPILNKTDLIDYKVDILDQITKLDIEEYLEHCELYEKDGRVITNKDRGKMRKLSSIKSMYNYFYRSELITTNPAALVDMPKLHEKEIIRLDPNEVAELLDSIDEGNNVTKGERRYYNKTRNRDLAIFTLLLGTGIRVSECVGLNIEDVDFDNDRIKVYRKGGYEALVYFGDEVREALLIYLEERNMSPKTSAETGPLFLSLQNKRICVRSVEIMVKKYTSRMNTLKKITPHKLRSTYGTNLYKESGDIYLVAEVLGHKDVNTTRKHYAAQDDEGRRKAANMVTLREKKD